MRIAFKETVRFGDALSLTTGPQGQILRALAATAPPLIGGELWITSANDSKHSPHSLHYLDRALDVRILGIRPGGIEVPVGTRTADVSALQRGLALGWVGRLRFRLGPGFDVVLESDHLHLEHDPR